MEEVDQRLGEAVKGGAQFGLDFFVAGEDAGTRGEDGDGFDLFGAHDGAEAAAGGEASVFVADAGHEGELLAGGPDAGDAGLLAVAFLEPGFGFDGVEAPEVGGVTQLRLVVSDEEVDGLVGGFAEKEAVPAGVLEGGAEVTAGVGVAPAAALR